MPLPRRGGSHRRHRPEGAMSSCNLPANIVADILSRLPVKSLVRFRCVCKPLKTLFADPKFIATHYNRTKNNHTLLVHSRHASSANQTISLLHTKTPDSAPNLDHPFPPHFIVSDMEIVGSINGLVCLDSPPLSVLLTIWNPATKQYRYLPCPTIGNFHPDSVNTISTGFAFDSVKNDYKVIRIVCFKKELGILARAEVFSVNSCAWREIKVDLDVMFDFNWVAVVKGVPYWMGLTQDINEFFFWFDAVNEVFRQLPAPCIAANHGTRLRAVNYKDSFAMLVYSAGHVPFTLDGFQGTYYTPLEGNTNYVDVWVMEEKDSGGESSWSKKLAVGPILGVERLVGCSQNGEIVVENSEGMLLVYNPSTEEVKNVGINGAQAHSFLVCGYSESLVSMRGFVRVGTLDAKFIKQFDKEDRKNRYRC
ncbi:hypothetical protein Vadar_020420 [Vaccinium darrowii]|uniref:Uncharacterized protein n=1 Tax=Vaccinium darrowii TaxID=229202 RepID=A0ACB7Z569_9ERIC|nr:hypothetical protein Vadar_020420 [Vaccinium darrowii]